MEGVSSHRTLSYSRWSYDRRHSPAHGISAFKATQEGWAPETGPPRRSENNQEEVLEGRKGDRSVLPSYQELPCLRRQSSKPWLLSYLLLQPPTVNVYFSNP
ncbi:unnamed protein product [Gulo gulo]|uniref:Uncharacterized protein n=1 Tax=Gulo gulo TaxID=48420 RepID=A0A9X9M1C1_GULGU|nr:unnamed protein product [Gulo gulo]